jgi:hypothetical protein
MGWITHTGKQERKKEDLLVLFCAATIAETLNTGSLEEEEKQTQQNTTKLVAAAGGGY